MSFRFLALVLCAYALQLPAASSAQSPETPLVSEPATESPDVGPPEAPQSPSPSLSPSPSPLSDPTPPPPAAPPTLLVPPPPPSPSPSPPADYTASARTKRIGPAEFTDYGTGSRVNAPLEEIPASVSILPDATLRERGATNLEQALQLVPSVTPVWTYGGFMYLSMRGFQAIPLVDGYRDTRPMIAGSAPQGALFDLDRIEVLRGPSSVLYGFGAVGGVVNLIRRAPSRTPEYTLDFGLGFPDQQLVHAGAQGPLGEDFAYRIDLGHVTRTDFRGATTERNQATASIRYTPSRNHSFGVRFSYGFDHYNTDVGLPTLEDAENPGVWRLPIGSRYDNRYNTNNDFLDYHRYEASADYRWDINSVTYLQLRGNVTRDYYDYLAAESLTYVPAEDMMPAAVDREYLHFQRGWTPIVGQLELHTDVDTGPVRHQLVFGYEINNFNGKSNRGDNGDAVPGRIAFAFPEDDATPTHRLQRTSRDEYRHVTNSLYALDHAHLLENLVLTGGLRFDAVDTRVQRDFLDRETAEASVDPMTGRRRKPLHSSLASVTGQIGVAYTPWTPLTAYVGYSSAWKPVFVYPSDAEAGDFDPERSHQVEGGLRVRSESAGHNFSADGAVFFIQKNNLLISTGDDTAQQAGRVESVGFDLTLAYAAPRFVSIDVNYALTDAEFKRYISADPVSGENQSLAGRRIGFTPVHSGQAWFRLSFSERIGIGIGGRLAAKQYADDENRIPLPDYALLDASAWIRGERVSFILSARNLLDHHDYFTSSINSYAVNPQLTPGPGREILGTLRLTL